MKLSDEAVRRDALVRLQRSQERRDVRLRRRLSWFEWVGLAVAAVGAVLFVWVLLLLFGVAESAYG